MSNCTCTYGVAPAVLQKVMEPAHPNLPGIPPAPKPPVTQSSWHLEQCLGEKDGNKKAFGKRGVLHANLGYDSKI